MAQWTEVYTPAMRRSGFVRKKTIDEAENIFRNGEKNDLS